MSLEPRPGLLVAVVGPSGAGKDTLMAQAARHPALPASVRFARRVVTRAALPGAEDHDSLDDETFLQEEAAGAFALTWAAHGLRYALPRSVARDIAGGHLVVANLSRRALGEAARLFGRLAIMEVTASPEILLDRLVARGRESEATIRDRLAREVPGDWPAASHGHVRIDNSADLARATEAFVRQLSNLAGECGFGR